MLEAKKYKMGDIIMDNELIKQQCIEALAYTKEMGGTVNFIAESKYVPNKGLFASVTKPLDLIVYHNTPTDKVLDMLNEYNKAYEEYLEYEKGLLPNKELYDIFNMTQNEDLDQE